MRLRKIAISVAMTTEELPNTVATQLGNPDRQPSTVVTPTPSATDRPTIATLRCVSFAEVIHTNACHRDGGKH